MNDLFIPPGKVLLIGPSSSAYVAATEKKQKTEMKEVKINPVLTKFCC